MNASSQIEYESRVRFRYGVIAFLAALLLVGSQLFSFVGPQTSVNELTTDLVFANKREGLDVISAVLATFGLLSVGVVLNWLFQIARVRNPGIRQAIRWLAVTGAALSAVMEIAYTIVVVHEANQFVGSGNQGYPEAYRLTSGAFAEILLLLHYLGLLLLTLGSIWTSLNAMRVGLLTRMVGYIGVMAGALFLFPIGALVPVVQGYWFAAVAITLVARWPSGDPPAWAAGEAVSWAPLGNLPGPKEQRSRSTRAQRRKVSDQEVLAAVEPQNGNRRQGGPSPSASAGKRKRKRRDA